jgi:hypothetical protein
MGGLKTKVTVFGKPLLYSVMVAIGSLLSWREAQIQLLRLSYHQRHRKAGENIVYVP